MGVVSRRGCGNRGLRGHELTQHKLWRQVQDSFVRCCDLFSSDRSAVVIGHSRHLFAGTSPFLLAACAGGDCATCSNAGGSFSRLCPDLSQSAHHSCTHVVRATHRVPISCRRARNACRSSPPDPVVKKRLHIELGPVLWHLYSSTQVKWLL